VSDNDLNNRDRFLIGALSLAGFLLALLVDALAIEPYRLGVTYPRLYCPRLPRALEGVSILLLADLHASQMGRREKLFLKMLETVERPDIIVWNGDLITGEEGRAVSLDICRRVRTLFPNCPTFVTLGNGEHKIGGKECRAFVQMLRDDGFEVLINENRTLVVCGEPITVAGTDDPFYGFADVERSLKGSPGGQFQLLFAHSPQVAGVAARLGVDVMLSGHTHGGQVRLPFIGAIRTQNPLGLKMDYGIFDRKRLAEILGRDPGGDLVTYITRGIGAAQVPVLKWLAPRFLCPPEISRVTLHRSESEKR
jgi:predicted MPP superfamily phosphohydrolase